MGRVLTQVYDPIVLYVSGGNTQVIAYSLKRSVSVLAVLAMLRAGCKADVVAAWLLRCQVPDIWRDH